MIQTDILIIGAGPCGLFTVFEAGLLKLRCHLIDALPQPGGQCAEIYPKKPIYDIPAYPSILAGELVDRLMEQAEPFQPGFTLGERAETIEKDDEDQFIVTTNRGTVHRAPIIAIAGGLGCFEPRKPPIANLAEYEDKGVEYIIKDPEFYRDKKVVISGGGDSALDWTIFLADGVASEVTLVHRREGFRGHLDSVQKVMDLAEQGKIKLLTNAEVVGVDGDGDLQTLDGEPQAAGRDDARDRPLGAAVWVEPQAGTDCGLEPQHQQERRGGRHLRLQHQRARGVRHRRHQHLPRQVEADFVRVPRSHLDGAERLQAHLPRQKLGAQVHHGERRQRILMTPTFA